MLTPQFTAPTDGPSLRVCVTLITLDWHGPGRVETRWDGVPVHVLRVLAVISRP